MLRGKGGRNREAAEQKRGKPDCLPRPRPQGPQLARSAYPLLGLKRGLASLTRKVKEVSATQIEPQ